MPEAKKGARLKCLAGPPRPAMTGRKAADRIIVPNSAAARVRRPARRPSVRAEIRRRRRRRELLRGLVPGPRDVAAMCAGAALGVAIALGGSL